MAVREDRASGHRRAQRCRYGMAGRWFSPFTFYCGAAKIMAADLAGVGPGFFGGEPSTCYPFWVIP